MLLLQVAAAAAAQYKWVEADGSVAYGDQPPADARKVERIGAATGATGADELAGLPFEVRRAARDFPVTLYTSPGPECAPCATARGFLKAHGIPFAERTIATSKDVASFKALSGSLQVPALTVGRNWLHGYEEHAWLEALDSAGYPRDAVLPRAWQWPAPAPLTAPDAPPPAAAAPESAPEGGY